MDILAAEKRIGYKFKNKNLLKRAFTLASFDAESNNEALEFFGDAVLEFIVSESIFSVDADEGELTERRKSLVCDKSLNCLSAVRTIPPTKRRCPPCTRRLPPRSTSTAEWIRLKNSFCAHSISVFAPRKKIIKANCKRRCKNAVAVVLNIR